MDKQDVKMNDATALRPNGERAIDAPFVNIDLVASMEQIRTEKAWKEGDRNAVTLFKSANMRIVMVALHQGAAMKKHLVDSTISVQVLEGLVKFITESGVSEIKKGGMITLHGGIPHDVLATEETIFLLTLATNAKENNKDLT